jgi:DNA-binding response OmpR family regulator
MTNEIRLLLVDDEKDFLEVTGKRLARRGFAVKIALTCGEAKAILDHEWPEVVVLDVMLPDLNGIQFLKEIKQKWPLLPVILLSGHASVQSGIKGIECGAYDYCLKPVDLEELIERVKIAYQESRAV